jgi:hypothetical protein
MYSRHLLTKVISTSNNTTRPQRIGCRPWDNVIVKAVFYAKMSKIGYN